MIHHYRRSLSHCLTLLFLCTITTLSPAFGVELKGKVVKTMQKQVEIELTGDLLPQIGDTVVIGFILQPVGFIPLAGEWQVSAIKPPKITASPTGQSSQPQKAQLVRIQSPNPQQRYPVVPKPVSHESWPTNNYGGRRPQQPAPLYTTQSPSGEADEAMWLLVATTTEPRDVEQYLATFPHGTHSTQAQAKLKQLQQAQIKAQEARLEKKTKRNVSPDLEQYLTMVESADYRQKYRGAKYIYKKRYGKNIEALQVLGDVLTKESQKHNLSRGETKTLIYICKLIGISDNGNYVKTLDHIANTTPNRGLQKYAIKYTTYLQKTTGVNR